MGKTLKSLVIIFGTIAAALVTSILYDIDWIARNWVRFGVVLVLILVELFVGFLMLRSLYSVSKPPPD